MKACGASPAHFLFQGVGGILFGLVTGWIAYRAMAAIDDPMVEILISIGVCAATYALSLRLNVSGPIAVVVTGLLIGNHGAEHAMSEKVQEYLFSFWEVIDELLNSVLFLLIGLEVLVLAFEPAACLDRARQHSDRACRAAGLGGAADHAAVDPPDLLVRLDPDPHLGRPARRRLGGAGAVAARKRRQAGDPGGDLRGGDLLDHRPGPDGEMGDQEDGGAWAVRPAAGIHGGDACSLRSSLGEGGARRRATPHAERGASRYGAASPRLYSCRSASIGSSRAPRSAGKKPNDRPIAAEKPTASRITAMLGLNGIDSA